MTIRDDNSYNERVSEKIKEALSRQIDEQIKAYIAKGGKIQKIPYGEFNDPLLKKLYTQRKHQNEKSEPPPKYQPVTIINAEKFENLRETPKK